MVTFIVTKKKKEHTYTYIRGNTGLDLTHEILFVEHVLSDVMHMHDYAATDAMRASPLQKRSHASLQLSMSMFVSSPTNSGAKMV